MKKKPMSLATVAMLLKDLEAQIAEMGTVGKALVEAPVRLSKKTLVDGPRRLHIRPSGVSEALPFLGSVWLCDPAYEFAQDGDGLWIYSHMRNGFPVAGNDAARAVVLERAVLVSYDRDAVRAFKAIRLLAELQGLPVPALGARQERPEAETA